MKKILSVVETAYRATIEEQDDTILWLNHILKNSGGDVSILLCGNAVNYAVKGQKASADLSGVIQLRPPEIDHDLATMIGKGVPVYLAQEDAFERGLQEAEFVDGVKRVQRQDFPELMRGFDLVWWW